ncbi:uncharacterized protein LY89DRAFT_739914 [Mollisia scopiformis]|uniref:DUF6594 domain-containing protein n=1 Tax=Mollisia scopiformis TaxID=149040 RepID=A0A194WTD4_MOLSC|nr:uncharacterized protein LY89DRAFT_739914 [Mollisia scopiformis]KUJ10934.1 hypothetical protein LY89DRAFT_739914 [Mollisia scopiformis]
MTTKYSNPTVESMLGDSDDEEREEREEVRGTEEGSNNESSHRHSKSSHESVMIVNSRKERRRRKHRSNEGSKYSKTKPKSDNRRNGGTSARDNTSEGPRYRHRRSLSHRSTSSTSSSDDDEPIPDHRAVLAAARARLTSPSMMSTFTTQTTATNTSSSSSGSNSTVTQMSVSKRSSLGKRPAGEAPLSPAVPDPPDVFTFMGEGRNESPTDDESHHEQEKEEEHNQQGVVEERPDSDEDKEEEEESDDEPHPWTQKQIEAPPAEDLSNMPSEHPGSASSSASSSFHGDDFSDPPADNDTDRSTSPERSVKGHDVNEPRPLETIPEIPEVPGAPASPPLTPSSADRASARMASQMAAAQQRQSQYGSMNQFGTPNMPRGNAQLPVVPPSALSARYPQPMAQRPLPRAEKLPVTGYELLASQLSTRADIEDGTRIKPLYRKFEALNHRLLLHLQDELSELEEQLHRLDHADTQSRRTDRHIVPASRRAAAMAGGELQWHKTDVLGRIGFKLAQYNQALTSFNETQSLAPPTIDDIDQYREYLEVEQPIHEAETHFLDPEDDLVSLSSQPLHHRSPYRRHHSESPSSEVSSSDISSRHLASASAPSAESKLPELQNPTKDTVQSIFPALAAAIATSILLPVLTFTVIPGFIGRLTVTLLVALFTVAALIQAQILSRKVLLGRESVMCFGIYGGVMTVLAGIMA